MVSETQSNIEDSKGELIMIYHIEGKQTVSVNIEADSKADAIREFYTNHPEIDTIVSVVRSDELIKEN